MFKIKTFEELTTKELYNILALRAEIFVVEQECVYNDVDGKDLKSIHIWLEDTGIITAYVRIVDAGVSYEESSIGRVIVNKDYRGRGLAKKIFSEGIRYITQVKVEDKITIGAQEYLKDFYGSFGFKRISDTYIEDGIPHLDMQYVLKK